MGHLERLSLFKKSSQLIANKKVISKNVYQIHQLLSIFVNRAYSYHENQRQSDIKPKLRASYYIAQNLELIIDNS